MEKSMFSCFFHLSQASFKCCITDRAKALPPLSVPYSASGSAAAKLRRMESAMMPMASRICPIDPSSPLFLARAVAMVNSVPSSAPMSVGSTGTANTPSISSGQ